MVTESVAWLIGVAGIGALAIQGIGKSGQQAEYLGRTTEDGEAMRAFETSDGQQKSEPWEPAERLPQQAFFTEGASVVSAGSGNVSPRCCLTRMHLLHVRRGPLGASR